jgi:hypothetical protein
VRKYRIALLALLLLSASAESGQTLGEVAKKERERRDRAGKDGQKVLVISEKELEEARGESLSVSGSPSEETPSEASNKAVEEEAVPPEAASKLTAKEISDLRQQWSRIWKEQLSQAEQELVKAKDDVYQCRSAEAYFFIPLAVDCDGVDLRLAAAEARLKSVKRNRFHWELLLPENQNR